MICKRKFLYITSRVCLARYICYLLAACTIVICIADLLCSRKHFLNIHVELHSDDSHEKVYYSDEDNGPSPDKGYTFLHPHEDFKLTNLENERQKQRFKHLNYIGQRFIERDKRQLPEIMYNLLHPQKEFRKEHFQSNVKERLRDHLGYREQIINGDVRRPENDYTNKRNTSRKGDKETPSHKNCPTFSATIEKLEHEARELDKILRQRFSHGYNVDNFEAIFQQNSFKEKVTSRPSKSVFRHNIVVMAYKRSGSSFLGQIFNQHPDVLYFYEPIYFLKTLERYHDNIYKTLSRHLLRTIFTCSFEENPYFVSQVSDSPFRLHSRRLSEPLSMCPRKLKNLDNVGNECQRLDVRTLIDMCHSHRHVVIKSIRIDDLEELVEIGKPDIEAPWNILKIVHLVRDPRAIISSRAHLEGQKWSINDYRHNARSLCTKMLNDLKSGTSRKDTGMYRVVRYEDIVMHQECALRDLFKFTSLPMSANVLKWLNENERRQHEDYAFSTAKNKTIAMNRWRVYNQINVVRVIEQECSIVMALLGYTKAKEKRHLQDISQPLFVNNDGPSIFMTKNITDAITEIMRLKDMGMLQ